MQRPLRPVLAVPIQAEADNYFFPSFSRGTANDSVAAKVVQAYMIADSALWVMSVLC